MELGTQSYAKQGNDSLNEKLIPDEYRDSSENINLRSSS